MKKFFYLLLSAQLLLAYSAEAQSLTWSAPVTVASGSQYGYSHPRVEITSNGQPIVMWTKNGPSKIIYSSVKNGAAFNTPVRVNPVGSDPRLLSFDGPNMRAVNDTVFVVYYSPASGAGNVYVVRSTDGGQTYGPAVRVNPANGKNTDFPYVDISSGGNPVVTYMQLESNWTDPRHVVGRSGDGGATFSAGTDVTALVPGEVCECCPPSSVIKGNTEVVMFRNNNSDLRDIWASLSYNGGASWTASSDIDNSDWTLSICPSSGPSGMISGDSLISVWMTAASGEARIRLGTMGLSAGQPGFNMYLDPISGNYTQNFPVISGNADTMGVVWQDNRRGSYDCIFAYSTSGAAGLVSRISWVDTSAGNQYNPDVAYSNGVFYFVYEDVQSGSVKFRTATIDGAIGIREPEEAATTLTAVPNPFDNRTILRFGSVQKETRLVLYDITGKAAGSYIVRNSDTFRLEKGNLEAGIYFITGSSASGEIFKAKLVVR